MRSILIEVEGQNGSVPGCGGSVYRVANEIEGSAFLFTAFEEKKDDSSVFTGGVECFGPNKMRGFFPFDKLRARMTIHLPLHKLVKMR